MKYKVGDKFLQEIEIEGINEHNKGSCPYRMSMGSNWNENALDKLRRPDDMTAEEAWEIAGKIGMPACYGGYACEELGRIFGTTDIGNIFKENTPQQAKAKIKAWEAEKEIKVGDIVRVVNNPEIEVMITKCYYYDGRHYDGVNSVGEVYSGMLDRNWEKTGRHIDIQGLLKQIGGAE